MKKGAWLCHNPLIETFAKHPLLPKERKVEEVAETLQRLATGYCRERARKKKTKTRRSRG
jgi:hypothetical protein